MYIDIDNSERLR